MYQNIATKCRTGEVRLSYVYLSAPHANPKQNNAEPKYSCTILIPKSDLATKADLDAAIEAAAVEATSKKWGGFRPPILSSVIHDGDGVRQDGTPYGAECKGHWVLTATSKTRPQVVDISNIKCELAPQDIYSGMYARVIVNFFGYLNSGNKGVGCGLGNVLKIRDGEPLSGGASAESDFADLANAAPAVNPMAVPQGYAVPNYGAAQMGFQNGGYTQQQGIGSMPPAGQINPFTGQPM